MDSSLCTYKYRKDRLVKEFSIFVNDSKCQSVSVLDSNEQFTSFLVIDSEGTECRVSLFFRNISGAGWSDKPQIKRIQIPVIALNQRQRKNSFSYLCGFAKYDNKPFFAFWDPENYQTHNTVCSCYIFISSFEKANKYGSFMGLNKGKEVFLCNSAGFEKVIKEISSRYLD